MRMPDTALVRYRPPLPGRLTSVVFTIGFCAFVGSSLVRSVRGDAAVGSILGPAAMLLLAVAACARSLLVGAYLYPEELVVRNFGRTYRVERSDVQDVRIGDAASDSFDLKILVVTRAGTVVTAQALNSPDHETATARRELLLGWRSGRPAQPLGE